MKQGPESTSHGTWQRVSTEETSAMLCCKRKLPGEAGLCGFGSSPWLVISPLQGGGMGTYCPPL